MHYLTIGVSPKVFELFGKRYLDLSPEEHVVLSAVGQHEILLSARILDYYRNVLLNADFIDTYLTAKANIEGVCKYVTPEDSYSSGVEELLGLVEKCELRILVAEKKDIRGYSAKRINLVSPKKLALGQERNFSRFVFPVSYQVYAGCSCENLAKWFGILLKNESYIVIIDKYIMTSNGIESLKHYYLPNIEKTAAISIYCSTSEDVTREDLRIQAKDECFDGYNAKIYFCKTIAHDRYIETQHLRISIGGGLDIMNPSGSVPERKECSIHIERIDDNNRLKLPQTTETLR